MSKKNNAELRQLHTIILNNIKSFYNKLALGSKKNQIVTKFKWLEQVQNVTHRQEAKKIKQLSCFFCDIQINNVLILIIHIEVTHKKQFTIENYQILNDSMHIQKQQSHFAVKLNIENPYIVTKSYDRFKHLLSVICKKVTKKEIRNQIKFYHSTDVFRQITEQHPQLSDNDYNDPIAKAGMQKIYEFGDVSEHEKQFFVLWNTYMEKIKSSRSQFPFCKNDMLVYLKDFIKNSFIKNHRFSLILHLNTIWSHGLIKAEDIVRLLYEFDLIYQ